VEKCLAATVVNRSRLFRVLPPIKPPALFHGVTLKWRLSACRTSLLLTPEYFTYKPLPINILINEGDPTRLSALIFNENQYFADFDEKTIAASLGVFRRGGKL